MHMTREFAPRVSDSLQRLYREVDRVVCDPPPSLPTILRVTRHLFAGLVTLDSVPAIRPHRLNLGRVEVSAYLSVVASPNAGTVTVFGAQEPVSVEDAVLLAAALLESVEWIRNANEEFDHA